MSTVRNVLAGKPSRVFSISPSATVLDATWEMNRQKIGALLVTSQDRIIGILTERDILQRVVAEQKSPGDVHVEEIMTAEVLCCQLDTPVEEASEIMRQRRVRHLPVCDNDGHVTGLVSIGDLNAHYATEQSITIHYLNEYLYGRV